MFQGGKRLGGEMPGIALMVAVFIAQESHSANWLGVVYACGIVIVL
jgi:hypothetical protein